MQREAEAHAEEDRKAKEGIEIRNNADTLAYQCEKQLKELGEKIDGAKKADVEKEIEKVREALKGSDIDAIKSSYESLQSKFQEISAELYKSAAASAGPGPEAAAGPGACSLGTQEGRGRRRRRVRDGRRGQGQKEIEPKE